MLLKEGSEVKTRRRFTGKPLSFEGKRKYGTPVTVGAGAVGTIRRRGKSSHTVLFAGELLMQVPNRLLDI